MTDSTDPVTGDVILDGAAAICPARHRRNGDPTEPPCEACWAIAETVIRAAAPRLLNPDSTT